MDRKVKTVLTLTIVSVTAVWWTLAIQGVAWLLTD